jgi:hypothetical protein
VVKGLWLWVRRRRAIGSGDLAIGYARERLPLLVVLAGLLALEAAVVGLLVPWWWVHVFDVIAFLQVLGIAATLVTHPHFLTADHLVLRDGRRVVLTIPRDRIVRARLDRKYHEGKTVQRDGDELRIVVGNQTDVLLQLSEPVDGIRRVRFRADEPTVLLAAVPGAGAREQSPRG